VRPIVFALDCHYVTPFKVLWCSLEQTNSLECDCQVIILHGSFLSEEVRLDIDSYLQSYDRRVQFICVEHLLSTDYPLLDKHLTITTYYRLFLASVIPLPIKSVVYMDVDMLAVGNIRELFSMKVEKPIAAVDHFSLEDQLRLWGDSGGSYFQAGLLVVDLESWRMSNIESQFIRILETERDRLRWHDQDVLNIAFSENWQRLPMRYNFSKSAIALVSGRASPVPAGLVHFDGSHKPWTGAEDRLFATHWYRAYKATFGTSFDLSSVRPGWKRIASRLKKFVRVFMI
jgi:lipopolysaccharide biosynthesis glycosyltransferase